MRGAWFFLVALGCSPRTQPPAIALAQPQPNLICSIRALPTRLVAACHGANGRLPARASLVLSFRGADTLQPRFVPRPLPRESHGGVIVRRTSGGASHRLDVLLDNACHVARPGDRVDVVCTVPAALPALVSARLRADETIAEFDLQIAAPVGDELALIELRMTGASELLARVNERVNSDKLHAACAGGDGDACVTLSELAWSGPIEWSTQPPTVATPSVLESPSPAPEPPNEPPIQATVSIAQPTPTCESGATTVCDQECLSGRFRSCLQASREARAKYGAKTAQQAWPALLSRCDHLRGTRPEPDDDRFKRWRLSCYASIGILDEAIDLLTVGNDARLVQLTQVVDTRCGPCD